MRIHGAAFLKLLQITMLLVKLMFLKHIYYCRINYDVIRKIIINKKILLI